MRKVSPERGWCRPWASRVQRAPPEAATALPGPADLCFCPISFLGTFHMTTLGTLSGHSGWAWMASGQGGQKKGGWGGDQPLGPHSGPFRMPVSILFICLCLSLLFWAQFPPEILFWHIVGAQ